MQVRDARLEDQAAVIRLLEKSRVGAGFNSPDGLTGFYFPYDPEYAANLFIEFMASPAGVVWVAEWDGELTGVFIAWFYRHDFGPVKMAVEKVWFVDPDARGSLRIAHEFILKYETWAKKNGSNFCSLVGLGNDPRVGGLYERLGYRVAEIHYIKAL